MRLPLVLLLSTLLTFTTSQAVPKPHPASSPQSLRNAETSPLSYLHSRAVDLSAEWEKAWCKGSKLTLGMIKPESQASSFITPVRSPWDGDLVSDFRTWGYRELPGHRDSLCDFGPDQHNLQRAFKDMDIETTSSAEGGPNKCFHVEHKYGPMVERNPSGQWPEPGNQWYSVGSRRMRETEAYTTLGINVPAGALYFFNRLSPLEAAHENWNVPRDKVQKVWLPDLAASSDHAWGFWSREHNGAGNNMADVRKIFSCMITNEVTIALIDEALRTYPLPPGTDPRDRPRGVEKWPGTTFEMHYDAAQVLLGSPNGQAAGYFLAQHKHRFGKSKTVEKVTVFRADKGMMPYLLFWVIDAPAVALDGEFETEERDDGRAPRANETEVMTRNDLYEAEHRTVTRSADGKNMLREHVIHAKL